jgi:hypothetical protein
MFRFLIRIRAARPSVVFSLPSLYGSGVAAGTFPAGRTWAPMPRDAKLAARAAIVQRFDELGML